MKKVSFLLSPLLVTLIMAGWALTSTSASAGMQWKWRDASGNIQYSDRPPPNGTPEQNVLSRPAASRAMAARQVMDAASAASGASNAAAAKPAVKASETELDAKRRKAEEDKQAQLKVEEEKQAQIKADNCQRARSYHRTLSDGIRVARTNAKGEREILDDKARGEETQRAQEIITANCK